MAKSLFLLSSPNPVIARFHLIVSPGYQLLTANPGIIIVKVNHTASKTPEGEL
jgi:hypothetical protein